MTGNIVYYPSAVLTSRTEPIHPSVHSQEFIQNLAQRLRSMCVENNGIGLAAPQIGQSVRMIITNEPGSGLMVLVNPVWIAPGFHSQTNDNTNVGEEGCLSLPGLQVAVRRYNKIHVQALTVDLDPIEFETDGLHARVLQHEIDHLSGVMMIDHLSKLRRSMAMEQYRKHYKKVDRLVRARLKVA